MAIYAYIYSGFPDDKSRKYYVCNYRKGNAYTYQVVPQLQREFDRKNYDDKTRIGYERFKKLRKGGYLYTSNNAHKRSPLYGEPEGVASSEEWQFLAEWLTGGVWPGEIDWQAFGRQLREQLEAGLALPYRLRSVAEEMTVGDETTWAECYAELRRRHLDEVWFHLAEACPRADIAEAEGRDATASEESGADQRLHDRIRETRPTPAPFDETESLARLGEVAGESGPEDWSALIAALAPLEDCYETLDSGRDAGRRVPKERLYELQWRLTDRLRELGLHHACAPAAEVDAPAPMHARFHAGARMAVVVQFDAYPPPVDRETLTSELRIQSYGGPLDGWSDDGIAALVDLLIDPATGRPSPAAPTSEYVAELTAWEVDEAIRRGADERLPEGERWNYSRLREELVLSAPTDLGTDALSTAREIVADGLETRDWAGAAGEPSMWRAGDPPLVADGLPVPSEVGGRLAIPETKRSAFDEARDRSRSDELDDADRARLMKAYRISGDLRDRTLADASFAQAARELIRAVTLTDFEEAAWDGWMAT